MIKFLRSLLPHQSSHQSYHQLLKTAFPAFFASGIIALLFGIFSSHDVSTFNRIVSTATAQNYNVSKVILNIILFIIIFILCFGLFYLFFNYLRKKSSKSKEYDSFWHFFDRFSLIASIAIAIVIISFHYTKEYIDEPSIITPTIRLLIIGFSALTSYPLFNLKNKIKFESYQKLIIFTLIISFAICIAAPRFLPYVNIVQAIFCAIFITVVKLSKFNQKILDSIISGFVLTFSPFLIFLSIFVELLNILNQHEIFISNPLIIYRIILGIFAIIATLMSFVFYKKQPALSNWQKFVYPVIVIGVLMLSIQLPLISNHFTHLMESANYSVLISDFLNFGKIPIIEHYGGHMLTGFFGGVFYGILNNDFAGAIYSPYAIYMQSILCIILYYLITKITDRDIAFLSVTSLPFLVHSLDYHGFGIIIIFSLLAYFKKPNLSRALSVDLCTLICILYRLDLGVSFGIATVIVSIIYAIYKKKPLKKLIIASLISVVAVLILWFVICSIKNLDATTQLKQFIAISASNQNWAFPTLAKSSEFVFAWVYIILPLIMSFSLLYLIFSKAKNNVNSKIWLILLVLGIAYFANFTRSIVRHNVTGLPDNQNTVFWTSYLYLAIFLSAIKNHPIYFLPTYISLIIINFVIIGTSFTTINLHAPLDTVMDGLAFTSVEHKVNRITIDKTSESRLSVIRDHITPFLDPEETFFDFTNVSLIYSYMAKPDPIYAAQTPAHLSGDYSQGIAIEDLKKSNVKLVLMPNQNDIGLQHSLDGIPNSLRYYKLSEYIYQNYTPLFSFEYGEIWILNNSYKQALSTAKELCSSTQEKCQILRKNIKFAETYTLSNIPLLWGEKDTKNASNNPEIEFLATKDSKYYTFDNNFDKTNGNYIKLIVNSEDTKDSKIEELILGNCQNSTFTETAKYTFTLEPGEHTYLFRVSHDEDWYHGDVNAIEFSNPDSSIIILEGD